LHKEFHSEEIMEKVGIGIIGCGNISGAYLKAMASFPILDIRGVADLNRALADAKAAEFNVPAKNIDELFADPKVEIIVNLTVPKAHVAVGLQALDAGKHTYSEKPLGINFAEGKKLAEAAKAKGLRIGAAPDTFLGGGHQTARALIDAGAIGQPVGGTATFMCPGHERWHPNPAFYYEVGGGPMLDMGPYYITDLVNLFGPVAQVAGFAITPRKERTITSEPRNGERIPVHVPTHVAGVMAFANGAVVQIGMSFDVAGHKHVPLEVYGTEGTLIVPDPNHFGGEVEFLKKGGSFEPQPLTAPYADGNYRSIGVADLAHAIRSNRPHRANGSLALHVLEVMEAFHTASETGRTVAITTATERPAPLAESLVDGHLGK
jgi:predicted dehydrogenase